MFKKILLATCILAGTTYAYADTETSIDRFLKNDQI